MKLSDTADKDLITLISNMEVELFWLEKELELSKEKGLSKMYISHIEILISRQRRMIKNIRGIFVD